MQKSMLAALFFLIGCTSATLVEERKPASNYVSQAEEKFPVEQRLSFDAFLKIASRAGSVESTLAALSKTHPEYLQFNTLMYDSLSLQASTFQKPRAIVFGPVADFIFTFNGDASMKGGRAFETVQYSLTKRGFEFREITYKYPGFDRAELDLAPNEIAYEDRNLVVSVANPRKCLQCHGAQASPIWASYYLWSGAYGADDDMVRTSFYKGGWNANNQGFFEKYKVATSLGRAVSLKAGARDVELEALARFGSSRMTHPRYQYLPLTFAERGALKYTQGVPLAQLDFSAEVRPITERYGYEWPDRPNLFFLSALHRWNSDRLVGRLETAGLKNAFASPLWSQLYKAANERGTSWTLAEASARIGRLMDTIPLRNKRPSDADIERKLRANLYEEYGGVRERVYQLAHVFGKDNLRYQPYVSGGDEKEYERYGRVWMPWIEDARALYTDLLGLKTFGPLERIAAAIETDDQLINTAIDLLLADRGIDLASLSMNLRQSGVTFHEGGLEGAKKYLGIEL